MKPETFNINKELPQLMTVKITGVSTYIFRLRVASLLIRLAAWIGNLGYEGINDDSGAV